MRRCDFLSLVSCAALAAIVPRPKYFFLNGVWQREVTISYDASMGKDQSCLMLTESNPGNYGSIWVRELWDGEEAARMYRKIANGEWESIPNVIGMDVHRLWWPISAISRGNQLQRCSRRRRCQQ